MLERAWDHWRAAHGLAAEPLPPVSSYVGYSIEEPWGRPRVVFGVDAADAEKLATLLQDCAAPRPAPAPPEMNEPRARIPAQGRSAELDGTMEHSTEVLGHGAAEQSAGPANGADPVQADKLPGDQDDAGTPEAATPEAATPNGATPDGATPDGATPDSGAPDARADAPDEEPGVPAAQGSPAAPEASGPDQQAASADADAPDPGAAAVPQMRDGNDTPSTSQSVTETMVAELAGWAAGELPGQASARLAAWAAAGGPSARNGLDADPR